jgi:hypothetical protein
VSTKALVPLLLVVAAGCDRGELVLLPARGGSYVHLDAAPAPDQGLPPQPRVDAGRPGPIGPTQFECNSDTQCGGRSRPRCDTRLHRCVECVDQYGCQRPWTCDLFTDRCVLQCQSDLDCSMTAQTRCDPNRHVCVGCTSHDQCVGTTRPFCEPGSGQCVECLDNNQCAPPWQFCSPYRNECVECQRDQDCPPNEFCGQGGQCFTR